MNRAFGFLIASLISCSSSIAGPAKSDPAVAFGSAQDSARAKLTSLYAEGKYDEVIRSFPGIAIDSLDPPDAYLIGLSYLALNDLEAAVTHFRRAVAVNPAHPGYRLQLAGALGVSGQTAEARQEYEAILRADSSSLPALNRYALLLMDEREYRVAAGLLARALSLNPRDFAGNYYLAACYVALGQQDSASRICATSITLNPDFTPAVTLLASLYYDKGDYHQARRLYDGLTEKHPLLPEPWYKSGLCSEKLRDDNAATRSFLRATELDSSEGNYFAHLGQSYFERSRFDSAVAAYMRASDLTPDNAALHLNAGLCWARMDSAANAIAAFSHALRVEHPDRISRIHNQIGAVYYNQKKFKSARSSYLSALRFDPENSEALFFLALTYDQLRDYRAASTAYARFLKKASSDPSLSERVKIARNRMKHLPGRAD